MSAVKRPSESLASGLFVALVAPPVAGAVFGASAALLSAESVGAINILTHILPAFAGTAIAAYAYPPQRVGISPALRAR